MSFLWNQAICNTLGKLSNGDLKTFKMMLWKRYPQSFNTPPQSMDMLDLVDRLLECFGLEVSLQITKVLLEEIGQKKMVDDLQTLCIRSKPTPMCLLGFLLLFNLNKRKANVLKEHL